MLYYSGIISIVRDVMGATFMATTREASVFCRKLLESPDGMLLWCKFGSENLTINSALTDDVLIQWGDPHRLPAH